jgi:hypothetical protein
MTIASFPDSLTAAKAEPQPAAPEEIRDSLSIDTTLGSALHHLTRRLAPFSATKAYVGAALVTYGALLVGGLLGPNALATTAGEVRLPFLHDWNIAFLFLVSFPSLVVLSATDQVVLDAALHRVQSDRVLIIGNEPIDYLKRKWERRFLLLNLSAYVTGVFIGALVCYLNYITYARPSVGYWIVADSRLTIQGYVFLYCVFVFYSLIPIHVLRSIAMSLFLRDVVLHSNLQMLPFHPDRCGGLRPVGRLGLRSQYALSVFGLNVVLLVTISLLYLDVPTSLYGLIAAAAAAYLILGPVVFLGPLLPFRAGMLRTKAELLGEVASRLRIELQRLRRQLSSGNISREDEELVDRLRKIGAVVEELPVWPFDAGTLRKFLTAYVLPILGVIGYPFIQTFVSKALTQLRL